MYGVLMKQNCVTNNNVKGKEEEKIIYEFIAI